MINHPLFLSQLLLLIIFSVQGQVVRPDTTFRQLAIKHRASIYQREFQVQSGLYNGSEYSQPFTTEEQHPFFIENDWTDGTIEFMGYVYHDVPILYDLTTDQLVTEISFNGAAIVLPPQKVKRFSLSGHTFVRIHQDTSKNISLPEGFYGLLYEGPSRVLVRREKNQQRLIKSGVVTIYYEEKNRYYIFNKGKYFPLKGRSSIYAVLSNQKQTLKKYARENREAFRNNRESAYAALAEYYDKLIQ